MGVRFPHAGPDKYNMLLPLITDQFLPVNTYQFSDLFCGQSRFTGPDSSELFEQSLKTQPMSWRYRTKEVRYCVNSSLYRAPEWSDIAWQQSVVILGCSNVLGIGLAEDETISACLSTLLDRPVINLGVASSGPIFAMQNSVLLNKNFPTPWAVINLWSDPYRINEFISDRNINHFTATSDHNPGSFERAWGDSKYNPEMHSYFAMKAAEAIWTPKTKYLSYSFWESIEENTIYLNSNYDKARDLAHPGPESAEQVAKILANALI